MNNTTRTTVANYVTRHRKEMRIALFLLAFAVIWLGAENVSSFFAGFFDGAAGV
ncbi:hypothetical protein ACFWZ3_15170 [Frateuria sp. GZRR35]|uniref:hypothetical protein n=1 Tax=unclassified Frateuria TaxID=2648894 RepID=UPI003EDB8AC3